MPVRTSLSSFRILIAVAGGLACTAAIAIGLTIWWLRSEAISEASREAGGLATVLAEQTNRSVQSIDLLLNEVHDRVNQLGVRTQNDFRRLLQGEDTYRLLTERMARLSHIATISLVDNHGVIVNSTIQWPMPPTDISDREHFQHVKNNNIQGIYISSPITDRFKGIQTIFFYKRVNDTNNEFLGIISIGVRLNYFQHIYESIKALHDVSFLFLRKDGTVLVRYPDSNNRAGEKLPAGSPWHLLVSQGGGEYRSPGYFDGIARQVAVRPLHDYPLVVNVAASEMAALATWRIQAITFGIGTLLVMLCLAFLLKALSTQFRYLAASKIALVEKTDELEHANSKVDAALNNMSQGLCMFDAKQRLIVCNKRYAELYGLNAEQTKPGTTLRTILEHRIARGNAPDDHERYINDRIKEVTANKPYQIINRLSDGRYVCVVHRPMADGGWVATHEDVTEAKRREESFRLLFEANPMPMWVIDRESLRFLAVNEAAVTHYGYSDEQFMTMTVPDLRPAEDRDRFEHHLRTLPDIQFTQNIGQHFKSDGTVINVSILSRALSYAGHQARLAVIQDITKVTLAENELRSTKKFLNTVIEHVPLPIMVKDVAGLETDARASRFTLFNRAYEELTGDSRVQLIGKTAHQIFSKERADLIVQSDNETLQSGQVVTTSEHSILTSHNGTRLVTAKKTVIRDENGKPQYLLTVVDDVTERRRAAERISYLAHTDSLTDLPNRATFVEYLAATLDKASKSGEQFAILCIDLDRFKETNDVYGHLIGDGLLREAARRLQTAAAGAFLARVGGDEFTLIVTSGSQPATAEMLGDRLLAAFQDDFDVEGHRLQLGLSIGGAVYPTDGVDANALIANADAALYQAKAETRGSVRFFKAELGTQLREHRDLQNDIRAAVTRGDFFLHYQPQEKITLNEAIGFEALARWLCPKRGMVSPDIFIPIAEQSSLIIPLGEWILREACREAASWPKPLTIAVNISPVQFHHGDLPTLIHSILLETGLAPARLELEITEGVLIDDFSRAVSILRKLKSLGVQIAMDDFGSGYSSLSYLHSFPFDKIKIDRRFIGDLEQNHHSMAIVRAIITLGHSLEVPVLAEGVETQAQRLFLIQAGCDEVQGYLTGRPLPIADYAKLVDRQALAQQYYAVADQ